jgi:hypothetical protein
MVLKINRFGYEYSISVGLATTVKSGSEDAAASLMPATVRLAIKTQTPVPDVLLEPYLFERRGRTVSQSSAMVLSPALVRDRARPEGCPVRRRHWRGLDVRSAAWSIVMSGTSVVNSRIETFESEFASKRGIGMCRTSDTRAEEAWYSRPKPL